MRQLKSVADADYPTIHLQDRICVIFKAARGNERSELENA